MNCMRFSVTCRSENDWYAFTSNFFILTDHHRSRTSAEKAAIVIFRPPLGERESCI